MRDDFKEGFGMKEFIDVDTGEVKVSSKPVILRAMALGSCVAVAAYGRRKKIGGLAHIMLPGRPPEGEAENKARYAGYALDSLFNGMISSGADIKNLEVDVVGGANLLGEEDGYSAEEALEFIFNYLRKMDIKPRHKRTGGTYRRSLSLDIESGKLFYSEGDGVKMAL